METTTDKHWKEFSNLPLATGATASFTKQSCILGCLFLHTAGQTNKNRGTCALCSVCCDFRTWGFGFSREDQSLLFYMGCIWMKRFFRSARGCSKKQIGQWLSMSVFVKHLAGGESETSFCEWRTSKGSIFALVCTYVSEERCLLLLEKSQSRV